MSTIILAPNQGDTAYIKAAEAFKDLYKKVTEKDIEIKNCDDGVSDLIIIGSDSVNDFLMNEFLNLRLDSLKIRYGTDDYCIRSYDCQGRKTVILAGGRGRSTLYAVYDYFERFLGCHYFWDGDILPKCDTLPMENIDVVETSRFEYRGLRYFAHRGLKRFQAEHWSLEDWKREIDWMVKKRLNFFMLRIGMDDIWQRAFPETLSYPEKFNVIDGADASGYNDRTDFWTLEYRGKLREKVLEYARDMDLMSPVDCGTMTHWYSRTPMEFLEKKKPTFITQEVERYTASDTGKVFDFTKKENMDFYMKLTETMVNEYDKSSAIFHTIGLGERQMFKDKNKNFALKLIAYRRILENIRHRYSNSKMMIASWDLGAMWSSEEIQNLVKELDPERTIILDYTSEAKDPDVSFLNWGVIGKFPWIFGLFHAYESDSELRGPYDLIEERLKIAATDEFCKGMIFWPELSHSDPLILEYLTENAWSPLAKTTENLLADFCSKRYGEYGKHMNSCWSDMLPLIKLGDWGGFCHRSEEDEQFFEYYTGYFTHADLWTRPLRVVNRIMKENKEVFFKFHKQKAEKLFKTVNGAVSALKKLASEKDAFKNGFILRDGVDLARTALGRILNTIFIKSFLCAEDREKTIELKNIYFEALDIMNELLSVNSDFSMYATYEYIKTVAPTNPDFEKTLKRNISNGYCSQPSYELSAFLLKNEAGAVFDWLINSKAENVDFMAEFDKIYTEFENLPLEKMQPSSVCEADEIILKTANFIENVIKDIF